MNIPDEGVVVSADFARKVWLKSGAMPDEAEQMELFLDGIKMVRITRVFEDGVVRVTFCGEN